MSLNFDLTSVKKNLGDERYNEVTTSPETRNAPEGQQRWHPVTDALIWMTMVVDMNEITEKNVDEWSFRIGIMQKVRGTPEFAGGIGSFFITRKDLTDHIGLRTNVGNKSRSRFLAKIFAPGRSDEKCCLLPDTESAGDRINAAMAAHDAKQKEDAS